MSEYTMTIDGQPVSSAGTLKVVNPATGEVFAEVPDCTREQLDVAMQAAKRAFASGWKDDYEQRRAVMYACADPQTVFRTRSQVIKKGASEAPEAW